MQWSVDEARWNTGVQLSPRSTRGYRIVDTATLLNILKGLAGGK